jgi:hypothetical protein
MNTLLFRKNVVGGPRLCAAFAFPVEELRRLLQMAPEAESADVRKVAFASPLRDGHNVVRIPEAVPPRVEIQLPGQRRSLSPRHQLQTPVERNRVEPANGADSPIPSEHLVSEVSRIRSQPPFMDARIATEGPTPFRDFDPASPAQPATARASLAAAVYPSSWLCSSGAHKSLPDAFHPAPGRKAIAGARFRENNPGRNQ